jgi:AhpD family alkylhydroperoxidase
MGSSGRSALNVVIPAQRSGVSVRFGVSGSCPKGSPVPPVRRVRSSKVSDHSKAGKELIMEQRLNYPRLAPEATRAMTALGSYLATCGLEHSLLELVKIRASQMNGCSFCIDMHTKDARAGGETEQRIYALNAWRETPFFSDRERAALAWVEALTHIGNGVPDDLYAEARKEFSEKELVDLTWAAAAINAWNRISISMRAVPGSYQPKGHPA